MVDLTLQDATPAPDMGDASGRLVARVQAWQHRHPLARRLPAADVTGLGVIALPYGPAEAGGQPQPLFHQPSLVPGLSHRALVDFAQRHAVNYRPGPAEWPQRAVERSDASPDPAPETRYLLTAAVTEPVAPGASPRRLLIAPEGSAIWGARPLSRQRTLASLGVLLVVLGAAGWGLRTHWLGRATAPAVPVAASSVVPAPAASVAMVAASPASADAANRVVASAVALAHVPAASVPASSPPSVPHAAVPTPAQPASTPVVRAAPAVATAPAVTPPASAPKASASQAASAVSSPSPRPATAMLIPPPKLLPMPSLRGDASASAPVAAPPPAPATPVAQPVGPHFALVSLPSKNRAGAEATLAQIHKLLGPAIGQLQAQIMPSPEGFVVTIWPMPTQPDAERLAEVLARRGVPMKWLEF